MPFASYLPYTHHRALGDEFKNGCTVKKRVRPTDREMVNVKSCAYR